MTELVIFGGGGFARELAWLAQSCRAESGQAYKVVCFIDDDETKQGSILNNLPIFSLQAARDRYPRALVIGGVGAPHARETTMLRASEFSFRFATLIHPNVEASEWIKLNRGSVICAGSILTVNIELGLHVQINLNCTVGHDVSLGDFTTVAPGVHISGCVRTGKRVYIGTGANIINGTQEEPLTIADDVIIGAGACVTKSILEPGVTVVGVPAKVIAR